MSREAPPELSPAISAVKRLLHPSSSPLEPPAKIPSACTTELWISQEQSPSAAELTEDLGGKWLLFFRAPELDARWEQATAMFRAGKMPNVTRMKVSTAMPNPKSTNREEGVIECYVCRGIIVDDQMSDEQVILRQGEELIQMFGYQSRTGWIYFKFDDGGGMGQTAAKGKGKRKNHAFSLKCGKIEQTSNPLSTPKLIP